MDNNKEVISILVENKSNVLGRIVELYSRRGFNIDSLTVSTTNDKETSRITIVVNVNEVSMHQIIAQTMKLQVVKDVSVLKPETSLYRELLLAKIKVDKKDRSALKEIVDIYRAKIVDLSKKSLIIELTGAPQKIDAFLEMIDCYDVADICRTGITGIGRSL